MDIVEKCKQWTLYKHEDKYYLHVRYNLSEQDQQLEVELSTDQIKSYLIHGNRILYQIVNEMIDVNQGDQST